MSGENTRTSESFSKRRTGHDPNISNERLSRELHELSFFLSKNKNKFSVISCISPLGPTLSKFSTRVPTRTWGEAVLQEHANHSVKEERPVMSVYPRNSEYDKRQVPWGYLIMRANQYATSWIFGVVHVRQNFHSSIIVRYAILVLYNSVQ